MKSKKNDKDWFKKLFGPDKRKKFRKIVKVTNYKTYEFRCKDKNSAIDEAILGPSDVDHYEEIEDEPVIISVEEIYETKER